MGKPFQAEVTAKSLSIGRVMQDKEEDIAIMVVEGLRWPIEATGSR